MDFFYMERGRRVGMVMDAGGPTITQPVLLRDMQGRQIGCPGIGDLDPKRLPGKIRQTNRRIDIISLPPKKHIQHGSADTR